MRATPNNIKNYMKSAVIADKSEIKSKRPQKYTSSHDIVLVMTGQIFFHWEKACTENLRRV